MSAELKSAKNPLLKDVRRAIARGGLTSDGCCVAETFHLLEEAIRSGCDIQTVIASESAHEAVERLIPGNTAINRIRVPDTLYAEISATENGQGVMALVIPPAWQPDQLVRPDALLVLLDGVQDPGNAGAIVRTAEAFGASGVIFVKGSVSPYNPKTIRASAGSLFRLPYLAAVEPEAALAGLAQHGIELYAAMPRATAALTEVDLSRKTAFVIGSEGRGVSSTMEEVARGIRIPTSHVESLNAGIAAGILLYECWRQRNVPA